MTTNDDQHVYRVPVTITAAIGLVNQFRQVTWECLPLPILIGFKFDPHHTYRTYFCIFLSHYVVFTFDALQIFLFKMMPLKGNV